MLKKLFGLLNKNEKYEEIFAVIQECKLGNNACVFFPEDNILKISIIMGGDLWQLARIENDNSFFIKSIDLNDTDRGWRNFLINLYSRNPQIVNYDNILECVFDFIVRNANIFKLNSNDLIPIASSLTKFIEKHKHTIFEIENSYSENQKNVWID